MTTSASWRKAPSIVTILVAGVVIAAMALSCGGNDDEGDGSPAPTSNGDATAGPDSTPSLGQSRDLPLPVGASGVTDGWEVLVVSVDFDAVDEVLDRNPNNEPPSDEHTFVIVRLNATNRDAADDPAEFRPGSSFRLVDAAGDEHATFDNDGCGVIPDGFVFGDNPQPPGGTVEGNICFHVPLAIVGDAVLFDDVSGTWFALR